MELLIDQEQDPVPYGLRDVNEPYQYIPLLNTAVLMKITLYTFLQVHMSE